MTVTDFIRRNLLSRAGLTDPLPRGSVCLSELRTTETDETFAQLALNRRLFGAFRYGRLGAEGKPQYNRIDDMRARLDAYEQDGNLEHLVDVANLAQLEFVEGDHPKRHFAANDDGPHAEERDV